MATKKISGKKEKHTEPNPKSGPLQTKEGRARSAADKEIANTPFYQGFKRDFPELNRGLMRERQQKRQDAARGDIYKKERAEKILKGK